MQVNGRTFGKVCTKQKLKKRMSPGDLSNEAVGRCSQMNRKNWIAYYPAGHTS